MIGGNSCEGGVDLGPIETDCPIVGEQVKVVT